MPVDAISGGTSPQLVLIVARSRINTVVVARIVERAGLRALPASPEDAATMLDRVSPALVILDGGAGNADCQDLLAPLANMRRASIERRPSVILLSTANIDGLDKAKSAVFDAVVSKPILPELLQPVVDRLLDSGAH